MSCPTLVGEDVLRDLRLWGAVPGLHHMLFYDGRTVRALLNNGTVELLDPQGVGWLVLADRLDAVRRRLGMVAA